jgi:hypothetical protein
MFGRSSWRHVADAQLLTSAVPLSDCEELHRSALGSESSYATECSYVGNAICPSPAVTRGISTQGQADPADGSHSLWMSVLVNMLLFHFNLASCRYTTNSPTIPAKKNAKVAKYAQRIEQACEPSQQLTNTKFIILAVQVSVASNHSFTAQPRQRTLASRRYLEGSVCFASQVMSSIFLFNKLYLRHPLLCRSGECCSKQSLRAAAVAAAAAAQGSSSIQCHDYQPYSSITISPRSFWNDAAV